MLEAANTYTGETSISGGTITITDAAALGATSGATTINTGGTLDLRDLTGVAEPINLNGGTLSASTGDSSITGAISLLGNSNSAIDVDGTSLTISSVISGTGSFDKTGAGTLVLEAANTYTGETTIDAGTLILAAGASIAESERVTVGANGIFDTSAITDNVYINSLAGSGSVINGSIAPNSLVIADAIPGDVFSGVISGSGGLRITGGTQTLTGLNTYSGPTVVSLGANLIAAIQSIPGDVENNGSFGLSQATPGTFANNMTGTGSMVIGGTGVITLTGTNTQSGGTTIENGASLMIGSTGALSGNRVNSNGGLLGIAAGITLSSLDVIGTVTLKTNINTTGAQSYGNVKLSPSVGNVVTLQTVNSDITINGILDGVVDKIQSMVMNAGTGVVTLGDSIGSVARLDALTVTGRSIYILADILTATSQTYNGNVFIGDASYLNRPRTIGFLLNSYRRYFEYQRGALASSIDYFNADPSYIRTLISEDPSVVFNGAVNDVVADTHTLLVGAIAPTLSSAAMNPPVIVYGQPIGADAPLYSLNSQTAVNQAAIPASSSSQYVGSISMVGGATTYSSQTYSAQSMTASATSAGGEVTFSVWDPAAKVNFILPTHSTNGVEQLNFYNGNLATLMFNGSTNYDSAANTGSAANQWAPPTLNKALGYVPPSNQGSGIRSEGAILRELLEDHLSTMSFASLSAGGSVMVSSPEEVAVEAGKSKSAVAKGDGGCSGSSEEEESSCAD